jgi:SpoVK/Ycf46/Vps4 family AAA+-type ATPase
MLIQILGEIVLLRLSVRSEYLGEVALPNSLLLYLSNSASKAVEFIHSKSKCLLFNISPEVLSQTQDALGLLQKVFKVAKTVSPAIIVMNQIEQVFYKKAVPENGLDPKVLKKELQKQLKNLKVTDRVLFIGLALEPWLVDAQTLCSVFDVSACISPADNSARYRAWKNALPETVRKRMPGRPSALARAVPGMEQELIDKFVYEMKINDYPETKFNEKVAQFFVESNIPEENPLKAWVKTLEAPVTQ